MSLVSGVVEEAGRGRAGRDGRLEIRYRNGNRKRVSRDGRRVTLLYYNGDVKETDGESGAVHYLYRATNTWHTQVTLSPRCNFLSLLSLISFG